jgi:hypothetical protein
MAFFNFFPFVPLALRLFDPGRLPGGIRFETLHSAPAEPLPHARQQISSSATPPPTLPPSSPSPPLLAPPAPSPSPPPSSPRDSPRTTPRRRGAPLPPLPLVSVSPSHAEGAESPVHRRPGYLSAVSVR